MFSGLPINIIHRYSIYCSLTPAMSSNATRGETCNPKPLVNDTTKGIDSSQTKTFAPTPGQDAIDQAKFAEGEKMFVESVHGHGSYEEFLRKNGRSESD
ncbi:hypothetical protein HBI56_084130 [Parastagonospora nodorum]|nr:hypothetical protein HBI10_118450 [Parastagonospora nodorum]KAH4025203.1 hypothetical protein HBI13_078740 [Parastagonospora nodorum]KAH4191394.1 hypothetical protein HBH42_124800 [Parastagonospora nodorum]KAH4603544.1 hypothetical protein HBH82_145920 [Parastagonospora nodorum]KAH4683861.1 hypothetical protein HBH78_120410 [Parastagonospora nodorum]